MDLVSSFLSQKNIDSEITFEKYIMLNTKLNNEKQYSVKDACYFNANNDNFKRYYDENKILEIHLNNMLFEQYLSFDNVKKLSLIINDNVKFDKLFINNCNELYLKFNGRVEVIDKININNCKFKQISINNHIDGNIEFQKCEFNDFNLYGFCDVVIKGDFKFNFCEVKEIANFMNFKFKNKAYFKMSKFKDNVYFNNSHFYDYADFHECEFEKTANFHECEFEKAPNFSQAIFKGNLNVVNANLNFDFDDLKEKINQECEEFNKNKKEEDEKSLDKFANDFRDSFRIFKSALIKDNNLLDASNFHKYELYCKEIELKQSWNKLKNVTTDEDIKQNNRNYSQLVDFLLLGFYRKLCDHHTDFLRVLNNLILLIALYALFIFGFTWLHDDKLKDTRAILTLFGFFDKFEFYFNIGVVICMSFGLILIGKNFIKSFLSILKIFQCLPYIKKWLLKVFKKEIFIKLFSRLKIIILDLCYLMESLVIALLIPCVFYILFAIFDFFLNLDQDFKYLLFVNSLFVSSYICLVYTKSLFFGRYVALILSYVVFFIMLINQPSIILPLIGKFLGDSNGNSNHASLLTLNILYTILMALVLFSLQKTARKNSIVPS
ncbi:pentapeptide repeat-containing protein [Campylobacter molothri]|uniref:pentapeptide repeat-containing protein n=1 Tax=Campylobacter molothri TaxID=1032242 RepID=UPI00301B858A|nr:pentapeptide repeat-containing protein [Campylobacter sp. RM9753]